MPYVKRSFAKNPLPSQPEADARSEAVHLGKRRGDREDSMFKELDVKRQRTDCIISSEEPPANESEGSLDKAFLDAEIKPKEFMANPFAPKKRAELLAPSPDKLLETLLQHRDDPEMLQCKIMTYAPAFSDPIVVRQLTLGSH